MWQQVDEILLQKTRNIKQLLEYCMYLHKPDIAQLWVLVFPGYNSQLPSHGHRGRACMCFEWRKPLPDDWWRLIFPRRQKDRACWDSTACSFFPPTSAIGENSRQSNKSDGWSYRLTLTYSGRTPDIFSVPTLFDEGAFPKSPHLFLCGNPIFF